MANNPRQSTLQRVKKRKSYRRALLKHSVIRKLALGAARAHDNVPLIYDALVSDPVENNARTELRGNGEPILNWTLENMQIVAPTELARRCCLICVRY
jgi:hypothetical protein